MLPKGCPTDERFRRPKGASCRISWTSLPVAGAGRGSGGAGRREGATLAVAVLEDLVIWN